MSIHNCGYRVKYYKKDKELCEEKYFKLDEVQRLCNKRPRNVKLYDEGTVTKNGNSYDKVRLVTDYQIPRGMEDAGQREIESNLFYRKVEYRDTHKVFKENLV